MCTLSLAFSEGRPGDWGVVVRGGGLKRIPKKITRRIKGVRVWEG